MNMLEALRNLGERAGIDGTAIQRMNQLEILRAAAALPDAPGGSDPSNVVWVDQHATGGTGTEGDPWTGWDTAITWAARTEYRFKRGWFQYATSPNFCLTGLALIGEQGATLKYTGTGKAVDFSAPDNEWVFLNRMENFRVQGHANADYGLWLVGLRSAVFRNIEIRDFKENGLTTKSCVANEFSNIYIPHDATHKPKNGVVLDARPSQQTTVCIFTNLIVEGATQKGIHCKNSFWNLWLGGAAENLAGKGLVIDPNGAGVNNDGNLFVGYDFELNNQVVEGANVELNGSKNHFESCHCTGLFHMMSGKAHNLKGGSYQDITLNSGVTAPFLQSLFFTGTFTNNANGAILLAVIAESLTGQPIVGSLPAHSRSVFHPDISAGLLPTNCALGNIARFYAFENFTLSNPTNPGNKQEMMWMIGQGGAGGWTITLDSKFLVGPHTITLSVTPGVFDLLWAIYDAPTDKWLITDFKKGYAV